MQARLKNPAALLSDAHLMVHCRPEDVLLAGACTEKLDNMSQEGVRVSLTLTGSAQVLWFEDQGI